MNKQLFLTALYDVHSKDLQDVLPTFANKFLCPVCLNIFSKEDVANHKLSDGHIWPEDLRKSSEIASRMSVLICKKCNNTAGSRGDKQMQLHERIYKGDITGNLYGRRTVKIRRQDDPLPIEMVVNVNRDIEKDALTITGRLDENMNWLEGSPEDQERFMEVVKNGERVGVEIYPHPEIRSELIPAGWVMSAYLYAFYRLGYRFILHESLDPVREYIFQSFDPNLNKNLVIPNEDNFCVREYTKQFFEDPELLIVFPFEKQQKVFLQINCWKYEIRLPFRYSKYVLGHIIRSEYPKIVERLPDLIETKQVFFIHVPCTKTEDHICIFDFLMGKPYTQ